MTHSLYFNEEKVVQQAEELCRDFAQRSDDEVLENLHGLIAAYRKSFREQQRVVRVSDRQQEQLRQITHELQEKTLQLQCLNKALEGEIETRKKLEADLRLMATTDALTGAFNRHRFYEIGQCECLRIARSKQPLVLLMLDIDRFKGINDRFGHAAGDEALRCFSRVCKEKIRAIDSFGRLGGEEFGVLLPDTVLHDALVVAERLRAGVEACAVTGPSGFFYITVSIGVVSALAGEEFEAMLARADAAMYAAKQGGRNRVEINGGGVE